ncbi:phage tail assembly chaperone [Pseudomonas sp. zfem002]|uniref:phage tail assembly chaperone n=1 Tax=Pseudomonas sp. zfem002 TaxID=3078197 RepID=UPI002928AC9B|nr:phage tail assembly chaperone [Pseudomonas sp. zfem002]MDU9391529.1 phage tail assembly chaperone [Pseudomonas sp. zfem002]
MAVFYHAASKSFFDDGVHSAIPDDAVPVTAQRKAELLEGERNGMVISVDEGGMPALIEPVADPELVRVVERAWRDRALLQMAELRDRHRDEVELARQTTLTADQYSDVLGYMQLLRDWPQSEFFPGIEHRPAPPVWIADQLQ